MLDLGSIGKGFALERAAELLREAGVHSGILHGGTSTVYALGSPPGAANWKVAVPHPATAGQHPLAASERSPSPDGDSLLAVISLKDEAMSVSAVWGKAFEANGRVYGHVIDPRKGEPVEGAVMSVVVLPSATETDALSTALLTLGLDGHDQIARLRPGMRTLVASARERPGEFHVAAKGIEVNQAVID
jgi:thiamine biosynthesis lipoprotein